MKYLSNAVTEITHNHPEGLKGAECIAMCVFLARQGALKEDIKKYVAENYYPETEKRIKNYHKKTGSGKEVSWAIEIKR